MRGSRVQAVVDELQGEKIDIIPWSQDAATFIVNALQPAEVAKVVLDEDAERIEVVVPDEQLSLAIGRRGQNVRLASQLTGWDIDILTEAGRVGAPPEGVRRAHDALHGSARRRRDGRPAAGLRRLRHRRGNRLRRPRASSPRSKASTRRPPTKCRPAPANISTSIEAEHDAKRKELGVADELSEVPGVTTAMMVALGENGIKTVEDFAGCAADDLVGWTERKDGETKRIRARSTSLGMSRAEAETMIMQARVKAGWITEAISSRRPKKAAAERSRAVREVKPHRHRDRERPLDETNERTCVVTRASRPRGELIRFVVGPDGRSCPISKRSCRAAASGSRAEPPRVARRRRRSFSPARFKAR